MRATAEVTDALVRMRSGQGPVWRASSIPAAWWQGVTWTDGIERNPVSGKPADPTRYETVQQVHAGLILQPIGRPAREASIWKWGAITTFPLYLELATDEQRAHLGVIVARIATRMPDLVAEVFRELLPEPPPPTPRRRRL